MGPDRNRIPLGAGPCSSDVIRMMMGENHRRQGRSMRLILIQDIEESSLFFGMGGYGIDQIKRPGSQEVGVGMGTGRQGLGPQRYQLHAWSKENRMDFPGFQGLQKRSQSQLALRPGVVPQALQNGH